MQIGPQKCHSLDHSMLKDSLTELCCGASLLVFAFFMFCSACPESFWGHFRALWHALGPLLHHTFTIMSPAMQRVGKWMPIFRDRRQQILLLNLDTGALREAPWISLRTDDGATFFANLFTRETRWFPPHLWMEGWVERCTIIDRGRGPTQLSCSSLDERSPLLRSMLDIKSGRMRVEGGAPYMHECGLPQYQPDEDDTLDTHPGLLCPDV